jgi:hypothetical protein
MRSTFLFVIISGILLLSSCAYYRVIPDPDYSVELIQQRDTSGSYIVIHRGERAWHAFDLQVGDSVMTTKLDYKLGDMAQYISPDPSRINRFNRDHEHDLLNSTHIYTTDTSFSDYDTVATIHESTIYAFSTYKYAKAPSRASLVVPIVLGSLTGVIILGILIKSAWDRGAEGRQIHI